MKCWYTFYQYVSTSSYFCPFMAVHLTYLFTQYIINLTERAWFIARCCKYCSANLLTVAAWSTSQLCDVVWRAACTCVAAWLTNQLCDVVLRAACTCVAAWSTSQLCDVVWRAACTCVAAWLTSQLCDVVWKDSFYMCGRFGFTLYFGVITNCNQSEYCMSTPSTYIITIKRVLLLRLQQRLFPCIIWPQPLILYILYIMQEAADVQKLMKKITLLEHTSYDPIEWKFMLPWWVRIVSFSEM